MAHMLHSMAFVGATPWHGLGVELEPNADMHEWREAAGMDWSVKEAPVYHRMGGKQTRIEGMKALVRSDTLTTLSVMSQRYKPVQPADILAFYDDLTQKQGFVLHTAGVLDEGRRIWALAETGKESRIAGLDQIGCYLLLATSMDGTLATRAMFTSVRVVCNNTLSMAYNKSEGAGYVSIRHNSKFDPDYIKRELGLDSSWAQFIDDAGELSNRKVKPKEITEFLYRVLGDQKLKLEDQSDYVAKQMAKVYDLFNGKGRGSNLKSADGTAWGLVNAVTEYSDYHVRAHNTGTRLNSAWFGNGELLKREAMQQALQLVA